MPPMPPTPPMGDPSQMDAPQEPEMPMGDEGMENDPKKELQKKAGKITKDLSEYQGEDRVEVAKYVKGMVDKAADNIIDGDDDDVEADDFEAPQDNMTEGVVREIINDLAKERGFRGTNRGEKKITAKDASDDNPFVAKR